MHNSLSRGRARVVPRTIVQKSTRPEQPSPTAECGVTVAPQEATWGVDDTPTLKTEGLDAVFLVCPDSSESAMRSTQGYGQTVGDRRHFQYRRSPSPDPDYSDLEEVEETDSSFDEAFTRSCVTALSNLIARRLSRAMIELIGIEPNPGPGGRKPGQQKKKQGKKNSKMVTVSRPMGIKSNNQLRRTDVIGRSMSSLYGADAARSDMVRYHKVLLNPWDEMPCRLGGENMQPTGVATLNVRGILSYATNTSIVFYPFAQSGFLVSGSTTAPYTYAISSAFAFPGGASLSALAAEGRIIAAGIRVTSVDNANNNQGVITIGCLPRNQTANGTGNDADGLPAYATITATQGYGQFFNYLQTESYPLRCGASAVWRPQDPLDFTFRDSPILNASNISAPNVDLVPPFVIGVSGGSATGSLLIECVSHIEYTVSSGTTGVISTGDGNMTDGQIITVARSAYKGLTDSTFEGVRGGLDQAISTGLKLLPPGLSSIGQKGYGVSKTLGRAALGAYAEYANTNSV